MVQQSEEQSGIDRVAAVSRRADGTPDQTKNFVVLDEHGGEHKVKDESEIEVAADVQRPRARRASSLARAAAETKAKETR